MGRRLAGALAVLLACCLLIAPSSAFYLPGVAPQDFARGDPANIKVNKLTSTKTQLPYEYYTVYSNPACQPNPITASAENLGEVLRGDRIENSVYQLEVRNDEQCKVICQWIFDKAATASLRDKIEDDYRVNMILDNMPVGMIKMREEDGKPFKTYERGYPVGFKASLEEGGAVKHFLNNHLRFTILYHKDADTDLARLVGFEVDPFSVKHEYEKNPGWNNGKPILTTCNPGSMQYVTHGMTPQIVDEGEESIMTYDVLWRVSDIRWASRWDTYLLMMDDQIHWFSIVNSLMIVLFLSGMVAMIMMRTLHRDISKYNQLEAADDAQEETGWKLVHGDVFRPPGAPGMLAVLAGTGVQLFGMCLITMIFAVLGFLSPANRGGLTTAMILLFVFMGLFAGYFAARLYKSFKGTEWKKITLLTAFLFPSVIAVIFLGLNFLCWGERSSGAVPFGTMFALIFLWFGISVPLVFVGSYFGFKKPAAEDPVRTNKIPRQIPEQPWYMKPIFSILVGGILPFGAVFIELFFILTSIWLHQFYYIFGFLLIVFVILIITCAEIAIVLCYFQLCAEDYHWWWRAFLTSGSSALYLFLYSFFYFFTKLEITKVASGFVYFGYMTMISFGFFVLTGTLGFYACLFFVRTIYGSVKID